MGECKFCDIINGKIDDYKIWENDKFLAFLDRSPANPGHCMLIPKKHVDYFFDLDDELYHELFKTAKKLSMIIKRDKRTVQYHLDNLKKEDLVIYSKLKKKFVYEYLWGLKNGSYSHNL